MRELTKGHSTIAITLALPLIVGAVSLGGASASVYRQRIALQEVADGAVLLGVAYLPHDPANAAKLALRYATFREPKSRVVYEQVSADRRSLTIVMKRKIHYVFGDLSRTHTDFVTARATATIRKSRGIAVPAAPPSITAKPASSEKDMTLSCNEALLRDAFALANLKSSTAS
ncbi:MAG TPA: hypothetical protein VFB33_08240 [Candidatus Binataceae bacterium]|jgi:hypothetical protein|nr:hypothetical protein [Candidatus Binataceae bacterium]